MGRKRKTIEQFIKESKLIHGDKNNYGQTKYLGANIKTVFICNKHGKYEQIARYHLDGNGCPSCKTSKGEDKIVKFLNKNNINFIREKRFDNCKNILPLPFDFYIQDINLLIEYDGEQHFKVIDGWGGSDDFEIRKQRDDIKNNFANDNGIELIRIPYNKYDKIDEILTKIIN